jgi:hypothetical protein
MGAGARWFFGGMLVRLSPDSACIENPIANVIVSQNIPRTAFDLFMVLLPFSARQRSGFSFILNRS